MTINHQSLIATKKTHRIVQEAKGRPVMEFGARRARGYDGATWRRAAYIGGAAGTAAVSTGKAFWYSSARYN